MILRSLARSLGAACGRQTLQPAGREATVGLFQRGAASSTTASAGPAAAQPNGAQLEPTVSAVPGTVAHHNHQVFVRLPHPSGSPHIHDGSEPWWPSLIEKEPGIISAYSAVAAVLKENPELEIGPVKVNACMELGDDGVQLNDVLIFPEGVEYLGLDDSKVRQAVQFHLQTAVMGEEADPPPRLPMPVDLEDVLCIFVCCHSSRDTRCGVHGVELAWQLKEEADRLVEEGAIEAGDIRVFQSSHIGGHKYAGNVIVHGPCSPYDGDWFGGLRAKDARLFLTNLLSLPEGCDGGHDNPELRRWWRGCIGMTKEEQGELYTNPAGCEVCGEDEEDEDEADDSEEEDDAEMDYVDREAETAGMLFGVEPMDHRDAEKLMLQLEAEAQEGGSTREIGFGREPMEEADDHTEKLNGDASVNMTEEELHELYDNMTDKQRIEMFEAISANMTDEERQEMFEQASAGMTEEERQILFGDDMSIGMRPEEGEQQLPGGDAPAGLSEHDKLQLYQELAEVSANLTEDERKQVIEAIQALEGMSKEELQAVREELQEALEDVRKEPGQE